MKILRLMISLLFFAISFSAMAQSDDNIIMLYAESQTSVVYQAELVVLDADSYVALNTINLPSEMGSPDAVFTSGVYVNNQGDVVLHQIIDGGLQSLRLYNYNTQTCCVDLALLLNAEAFDVGGFDPTGRRFAFSYVGGTDPNNSLPDGGIAIYDLDFGAVSHNFAMSDVIAAINGPQFAVWANMGDWTDQGILFAPNCYGCEGVFEGEYAVYDPNQNAFSAQSGVLFQNWYGKRLDATGEFLYVTQNPNYSFDPTPGMFPVPNVVIYNPNSISAAQSAPVIFASDDMLAVDQVAWVNDGMSILVASNTTDFWMIRDRATGQLQSVTHEADETVLGGLANGWLSHDTQANGASNVKFWNGTTFTPINLLNYPTTHDIRLVQSPFLGASLTTISAFPAITPPQNVTVQCAGFLPSRLTVNETARVTPGDANNVRQSPTTASNSIGQIPGGESFIVLEGPICDSDFAWWQVNYNGLIGWTVEGSGETYWLEPVP